MPQAGSVAPRPHEKDHRARLKKESRHKTGPLFFFSVEEYPPRPFRSISQQPWYKHPRNRLLLSPKTLPAWLPHAICDSLKEDELVGFFFPGTVPVLLLGIN